MVGLSIHLEICPSGPSCSPCCNAPSMSVMTCSRSCSRRIELHGYLMARSLSGFNGGVMRPAAWAFAGPSARRGKPLQRRPVRESPRLRQGRYHTRLRGQRPVLTWLKYGWPYHALPQPLHAPSHSRLDVHESCSRYPHRSAPLK